METEKKEINQVLYKQFLNTGYLGEEDLYLCKNPDPKYRFNIIGTGMMGMEHIRVTVLEGHAAVHGIYDKSPRSLRSAKEMFESLCPGQPLQIYDSLTDACNDPEADALFICTPNFSHIGIVREAVKSEKPIFLEKPMVTTLEDAIELREIAKDYPAVFQVGLQYRYKAIYTEARREILERNSLGQVRNISIVENRLPFLDKVEQWNKISEYSGGTLVEKCCHYFDLFNLFAQSKPKTVYAVGGQDVNFTQFEQNGRKSDILDNAYVTVVYENGVKCSFHLCMFSPMFYEEITICGDKGRIRAYENENLLPTDREPTHFEMHLADHGPSIISSPCYPAAIQQSGHSGGTFFEHRMFIDRLDGKETDAATVEDGFWSVLVGIAAEQSVKTGKVVEIEQLSGNELCQQS